MSNREYYLTVGIPVYNGEKYISRCIHSILGQKNIRTEIIIALDISSDNSEKMLDSFQSEYDNINVIKKSLGEKGPGKSRNLIIEAASSEYLYFIDIDDYLYQENVLFCYLDQIKRVGSDLLIGSHIHLDNPEKGLFLTTENFTLSDEIRTELFSKYSYSIIYSWNKIYRVKWLKENRVFNKFDTAEDLYFFGTCLIHASSISLSNQIGIVYDTGNPFSETNDVIFNVDEIRIKNYIIMGRAFASELTLTRSFDGRYIFSYLLWLQTVILRDGFLRGKLSLMKTVSFIRQARKIEKKLSLRRRLIWEFDMKFKKYLMVRYVLP